MENKKYRLLTKGYGYHPFTEQKKSDSVKELLETVAGMGGNADTAVECFKSFLRFRIGMSHCHFRTVFQQYFCCFGSSRQFRSHSHFPKLIPADIDILSDCFEIDRIRNIAYAIFPYPVQERSLKIDANGGGAIERSADDFICQSRQHFDRFFIRYGRE